jgi:hypothetical protein
MSMRQVVSNFGAWSLGALFNIQQAIFIGVKYRIREYIDCFPWTLNSPELSWP